MPHERFSGKYPPKAAKMANWATFKMLLIQGLGHYDKGYFSVFPVMPRTWNPLDNNIGRRGQ